MQGEQQETTRFFGSAWSYPGCLKNAALITPGMLPYRPRARSLIGCRSSFPHLIMNRAWIEPAQQGTRRGWHDSRLIVGADKGANRSERREPHDRDELHLLRMIASQEVNAEESLNRACGDPLEDLSAEEALVGVGILGAGPSKRREKSQFSSFHSRCGGGLGSRGPCAVVLQEGQCPRVQSVGVE